MTMNVRLTPLALALMALCLMRTADAAIGLDRTRVVFEGGKDAVSMNITNNNTQLPYLAQGWIEDEQGNKITSPLIVLPPVQRLEPGKRSQVKVQSLPAVKSSTWTAMTLPPMATLPAATAACRPTAGKSGWSMS